MTTTSKLSPEEKIARLPVWVQDHIERLERKAAEATQALEQLRGSDPRPATMIRNYWGRDANQAAVAWGQYDSITLFPSGVENDHDYVDVSLDGKGGVSVRAGHGLTVEPNVSNSITVRTKEL